MRLTKTFWKLADAYKSHPRYIDSEGGTRSGKTYSMLQLLYLLAANDKKPTTTSVVSESLPHLKRGCIRDFQDILGDSFDEESWNKTDGVYTLPNGSIIEFFGVDNVSKVHGSARDRLFINEAQNIPYAIALQLFVRTRSTIFYDYNPTHEFWAHTDIQPRENCIHIHSTYKDNDFLSAEQVAEIENQRKNLNWWRVYGEGKVGQLEGVIFDFETIDEMPQDGVVVVYGMDFGFTNDPTTLIKVAIDTKRKICYLRECCYRKGMLNADIAAAMDAEGIAKNSTMVFADCAEPKTIEELHRAGWNVKPCYKGTRKAEQLQAMRGYDIKVTKDSINLLREMRGYVWDKDKDGNLLNEPIGINDHCIDAARYGLFTYITTYLNRGKYRIQ